MSQSKILQWSSASFENYVLISGGSGFVNNKQCTFISHFWRKKEDPDPEGIDLSLLQADLRDLRDDLEPSTYIWVDWTCLPQAPRTAAEDFYFQRMLRRIPALVQDCSFLWSFPEFKPRAWVLYEVATFTLNHSHGYISRRFPDDIEPYLHHVQDMVKDGVAPTLRRHGYKCTNESDLKLVTSWLEILVILFKNVKGETRHQMTNIRSQIMRQVCKSFIRVDYHFLKVRIDKKAGTLILDGITHKFSPIPKLPETPRDVGTMFIVV